MKVLSVLLTFANAAVCLNLRGALEARDELASAATCSKITTCIPSSASTRVKKDCSSYFRTTVVDSAATKTTTVIVKPNPTTISTTKTVTTTSTDNPTTTFTPTTVTTSTPTHVKRAMAVTTITPSSTPTYASACASKTGFSKVCSCLGISSTVVTSKPTVTKTSTSNAPQSTITKTKTQIITTAVSGTRTVTSTAPVATETVACNGGFQGPSFFSFPVCGTEGIFESQYFIESFYSNGFTSCANACNTSCYGLNFQISNGICSLYSNADDSTLSNNDFINAVNEEFGT